MGRVLAWSAWSLAGLPLVSTGLWLVVFDAPRLACVCLATAALLVPTDFGWRRARFAAVPLLLAASAFFYPVFAEELGTRLDQLAKEKDRSGATAFSYRDALGVYGLNLVMGAGGWVAGYPEVAVETLGLTWPGAPMRSWDSDFAMRSPRVRRAVRALAGQRPSSGIDRVDLTPQSVAWSGYGFENDSMRVALAVNSPFVVGGSLAREGGDNGAWTLDLHGTARIAYPRKAFIPLGRLRSGEPWGLDEGLFWVLEERGWLHPYTARWHWRLRTDDPGLADGTTVQLAWRERAFQTIWRLLEQLAWFR